MPPHGYNISNGRETSFGSDEPNIIARTEFAKGNEDTAHHNESGDELCLVQIGVASAMINPMTPCAKTLYPKALRGPTQSDSQAQAIRPAV